MKMANKNRDIQLATQRRWYARHRESERARDRARRAANPAAAAERGRRWELANPRKVSAKNQRGYARRKGAPGSHTETDWQERLAQYGGRCAYCLTAPAVHREHMTPLTRGGSNDISNIVPACLRCNSSKGRRTLLELRFA